MFSADYVRRGMRDREIIEKWMDDAVDKHPTALTVQTRFPIVATA